VRGFLFDNAFVIDIAGKHAKRYLQNRLSNDIALLQTGGSCLAAALNAQGKIEAFGVCYCQSEVSYLFYSTGGDPVAVINALQRFRVTEQVTFTRLENSQIAHLLEKPSGSAALSIQQKRVSDNGNDIIALKSSQLPAFEPLTDAEWYELRFAKGHPTFPEEIDTDMLLSETGLADAVSFTKGCYVGQEVIAKIDSAGKSPRLLRRVETSGKITAARGTKLQNGQGRIIGEIRSLQIQEDLELTHGFALLKNDPQLQDCRLDGVTFRIFPER
jgi:folate-binding protein YgfZ